jgi:hypothetical protein
VSAFTAFLKSNNIVQGSESNSYNGWKCLQARAADGTFHSVEDHLFWGLKWDGVAGVWHAL